MNWPRQAITPLFALLFAPALFAQRARMPSDSLRDQFADVNGVRLHYRIGGNGPTLVLLHGMTMSAAWWNALAPQLLTDHRVIVPDLRGHGSSTNPSGIFRQPDAATDVVALLDRVGIREFSLLGHSAGAGISLHIAAHVPERVQKMMIISLTHRVTDDARAGWSNFPPLDSTPPQFRTYWLSIHRGGRPQIDQVLAYLRHFADSAQDLNLPSEMMGRIKTPTMIVVGDRDEIAPVEIATELYRKLPNAQLWVVPNTGHSPVWAEWGGNPAAATAFPGVVKSFFAASAPTR